MGRRAVATAQTVAAAVSKVRDTEGHRAVRYSGGTLHGLTLVRAITRGAPERVRALLVQHLASEGTRIPPMVRHEAEEALSPRGTSPALRAPTDGVEKSNGGVTARRRRGQSPAPATSGHSGPGDGTAHAAGTDGLRDVVAELAGIRNALENLVDVGSQIGHHLASLNLIAGVLVDGPGWPTPQPAASQPYRNELNSLHLRESPGNAGVSAPPMTHVQPAEAITDDSRRPAGRLTDELRERRDAERRRLEAFDEPPPDDLINGPS